MKLTITTNSNAQKILGVYDIFFTPGNLQTVVKGYSSILDFYDAYRNVIEAANLLYNSKNEQVAFKRFPSIDKTTRILLDAIDMPKLQPNVYCNDTAESSGVLAGIGKIASDIFHSKESEIRDNFSRMLEAKLPEQITLILAEKKGFDNDMVVGGHALNADPAVIGCYLSHVAHKDPERLGRELLCVALHELLHLLLPRKSGLIGTHDHNLYEEALVSYLAPEGILTGQLGLSEPISVDRTCERMVAARPYLKSYAEMLLPAMKRYTSANGGSFWEFVNTNK